jgi:hypothetical protein
MEEMQEGLKALSKLLDPYDWFYDVLIEDRRYVVYVHQMDASQDVVIPDRMLGYQVVVHFASAIMTNKDDYLNKSPSLGWSSVMQEVVTPLSPKIAIAPLPKVIPQKPERAVVKEPDNELLNELSRLQQVYGSNILENVFFEVRDGKNAVTNLSSLFPEVSQSIQRLYREYGFDIIYQQLEN